MPTTLLEIILLATAALWLGQKKIFKSFIQHWRSWPLFDLAIALLLFSVILSVFTSLDAKGALGIAKTYFVEPILFFYLVIDLEKSEEMTRRIGFIIKAFVIVGVFLSLWGITQSLFGWIVVTPHEALGNRGHGPFNSANSLALFLEPVFFLSLDQLWKHRNILSFLIVCVLILAILATYSSGAVFAVLLGLIFFFLTWRYSKVLTSRLWIIVPLYSIIVFIFLSQVSLFTPKDVNPWQRPSNDTLTPRLCLFEGTSKLLADKPFLGAGLNGFPVEYKNYYTCDAEALQYPHNFLLNFWVELGLAGLLAVLLLLTFFFKKMALIMEQRPEGSLLAQALVCGLISLLIHGLVDVPYFKNDLSLQFWTILALGYLLFKREKGLAQNLRVD